LMQSIQEEVKKEGYDTNTVDFLDINIEDVD